VALANVTLSGTNSYTGGTTVSGGTLTGTTSSLQGNILNNAAVAFSAEHRRDLRRRHVGDGRAHQERHGQRDPDRHQQLHGRHDGVGRHADRHDVEPAGRHR
jgi:autotransporter-associated beta strand protein